jgi:SAM-dependent methyltransferase
MTDLSTAKPDFYGRDYFEGPPEQTASGYPEYNRWSSRANVAAYLLWKHLSPRSVLDAGCAMGFIVEALRELNIEAKGTDFSHYALGHGCAGAKGHVFWSDLTERMPLGDASFDAVSIFETLEHLPPAKVPSAVSELFRVARGFVVATVPSFGANPYGPSGWFEGKVRPERLDHYRSLGPQYDGPVPAEDLARDANGQPIQGHLTIASFAWWTRQFEQAGFRRNGQIERAMQPDLERYGRTGWWDLYVFQVPGAETSLPLKATSELKRVEKQLGLRRLERQVRVERWLNMLPWRSKIRSAVKCLRLNKPRIKRI